MIQQNGKSLENWRRKKEKGVDAPEIKEAKGWISKG